MYCQRCGSQLGTGAGFCSRCGAPINAVPAVTVTNVYRGKIAQAIGSVLAIIGLLAALRSCASDAPANSGLWSLLVFALGLTVYILGRIQHWYHAE